MDSDGRENEQEQLQSYAIFLCFQLNLARQLGESVSVSVPPVWLCFTGEYSKCRQEEELGFKDYAVFHAILQNFIKVVSWDVLRTVDRGQWVNLN